MMSDEEFEEGVKSLLQTLSSGLKHVPEVTQKEIDDIKLEDLQERNGRKGIAPIRPEWIVGEPCEDCGGGGYTCDPPVECHKCKGIGEINLVKVHAETEEEARKAYKVTYKK